MTEQKMKEKLSQFVRAGFPIIFLHTFEENKADRLIGEIKGFHGERYEWNASKGFIDFKKKTNDFEEDVMPLLEALKTIVGQEDNYLNETMLIFKDVVPYLEDKAETVSLFKAIANRIYAGKESVVIIVSSILEIPKELEQYITVMELGYPNEEEIRSIVDGFVKENELEVEESLIEKFSEHFKGLTEFEIKQLLNLSLTDNGMLDEGDLSLIKKQKQQIIKKAGILEMIPLKEKIDDIGGLENLKDWLGRKETVFTNYKAAKKFGVLEAPKGVLIAGCPGCGKSLSAKAVAYLFNVPLLRMDMGRLMGKYVGESESNMREAIALAEAISPCVLWIDELEKAFAGVGGGGSEVTTRLFGNFLTWMQEKTSQTFVVATANNISHLPPELMRKGRFDEIFYVGLPNRDERKKIFEIHISKRRKEDLSGINLDELASKTEGFSGADIEGVVKDTIENAFADGKSKTVTDDYVTAIKNTRSLSEIMKEELKAMKKVYEDNKFKNASR